MASPEPEAAGEPAPAPPAPAPHDPGPAVPAEQDGQAAPALLVPPLATPEPAPRQRLRERLVAAIRRSPGIASGTIDEDPANAGERAPLRLRLRLAGAPLSPTRVRSIDVTLQFDDAPMDRPYRISELGAGDSMRSRILSIRVSPDLGDIELEQLLGPMLVEAAATAAEDGGRAGLPTWLSPQRQAMLARLAEAYAARDEAVARARQALAEAAPTRLLAELAGITRSSDPADVTAALARAARLREQADALESTARADMERARRVVDGLERTLGLALDEKRGATPDEKPGEEATDADRNTDNHNDASSAEEQAEVSARRAAAQLWMESVGLTQASYHLTPPPEDELAAPPEGEDGHQKQPGLLGRLMRRRTVPGPVTLTVPAEPLAHLGGPPNRSTMRLSAAQLRRLAGRVAEVLGATVEASPGAAPTLSVQRPGESRAYGFRLDLAGAGPARVQVDPSGDASVVIVAAGNTDEAAAAVAQAVAMALGLFDYVGGPAPDRASRGAWLERAGRAQESIVDGRLELADRALVAQVVLAAQAWRAGEPAPVPGHLALLHRAGVMPGQPAAQARRRQILAAVPERSREMVAGYVNEAAALQEAGLRAMLTDELTGEAPTLSWDRLVHLLREVGLPAGVTVAQLAQAAQRRGRPATDDQVTDLLSWADRQLAAHPGTEYGAEPAAAAAPVARPAGAGRPKHAVATPGAPSGVPGNVDDTVLQQVIEAARNEDDRYGRGVPRLLSGREITVTTRDGPERRVLLEASYRQHHITAEVRVAELGNTGVNDPTPNRKLIETWDVQPDGTVVITLDPRHRDLVDFLRHGLTEYALSEFGYPGMPQWRAAGRDEHDAGVLTELLAQQFRLTDALRDHPTPDAWTAERIARIEREIDSRLHDSGYLGPDTTRLWALAAQPLGPHESEELANALRALRYRSYRPNELQPWQDQPGPLRQRPDGSVHRRPPNQLTPPAYADAARLLERLDRPVTAGISGEAMFEYVRAVLDLVEVLHDPARAEQLRDAAAAQEGGASADATVAELLRRYDGDVPPPEPWQRVAWAAAIEAARSRAPWEEQWSRVAGEVARAPGVSAASQVELMDEFARQMPGTAGQLPRAQLRPGWAGKSSLDELGHTLDALVPISGRPDPAVYDQGNDLTLWAQDLFGGLYTPIVPGTVPLDVRVTAAVWQADGSVRLDLAGSAGDAAFSGVSRRLVRDDGRLRLEPVNPGASDEVLKNFDLTISRVLADLPTPDGPHPYATATPGGSSAVPAGSLSEPQLQPLYREILAAAGADQGRRGDWMPTIIEATPLRNDSDSTIPEADRPITGIRLQVRFRGRTFDALVTLGELGFDQHSTKKVAELRAGPAGPTIHIDPWHGHPMAFLHHVLLEYAISRTVPAGLALPAPWLAAHPAGSGQDAGVLAEIMHLVDRIARVEGELDKARRRSKDPDRDPSPDPGLVDELYQEIDARLTAYGYHGPDQDARWAAADALVHPDGLDPDRRRIYDQLKHRTDELRGVLALVRDHRVARAEARTADASRLRGDFEQEVQALTADQRRWLGAQLGAGDVELTTTLSALAAPASSAPAGSERAIDLAAVQALLGSVPGAVVTAGPTGQVLRFTPRDGAAPWEITLGSTFGSGESRVASSPSSPGRSIVLAEGIEEGYDLGAGLSLGQVVAGLALARELRDGGAGLYQELVAKGLMPLVTASLAQIDTGTTTISAADVAAAAAHLFRAGRLDEIPAFVARYVGRARAANGDLAAPDIGSRDPTVAGLRSAMVVLAQFAAALHKAPAGTVGLPPGSADAAVEALGAILRSPEGRAALDGTSIGSRPDVVNAQQRLARMAGPAPASGPLPPATGQTFDEAVAAWRNALPGDRPALAERLVAAVVAEVGVVPPEPAKTSRWRRRAASTPASAHDALEAVTRKAVDRLLADADHADVHVVRAELTAALAWAANSTGPDAAPAAPAAALTALQVMHAGTNYAVAQADRTAALAVAGEILAYHRGLDWQALLSAPAWTFAQSALDEYRRRADDLADLRVSPIEAASAALPEAWSKDQTEGSHTLQTQLDGLVDRLERASAALEKRALAHHRQAVAKAEEAARLTAEADTERDSREAATRQGRFRDRQSRMREAAARQAAEFAAEDAAHHRRVRQRYHAATDAARTAQVSSQRARDVAADPARAGQVDGEIGSVRTDITAFLDAVRQVAPDRHVLSAGVPLGDVPGLNALTREINAVTGGRLAPADVAAMMQESWRLVVEEGGTRFTVPDASGNPVDVLVAWRPEDAVEELVPTLRVGAFGVPVDVTELIIGQIPTYISGRNVVGATMSRSTTLGLPLARAKVFRFRGGPDVSAGRTRGVHVDGGQYVMSGGVMDNRGPATAFNYTGTWSVTPVAHPDQTRIVRPGEQIHDAATLTLVLPDTLTEPAEEDTSATGQNTLTTLPGHALTALTELDDVYDEVINGLRAAGVTVDAVLERWVKTLVFELYPDRLTRTAHFTGGPAAEGLHESVDLPKGRRVLITLRTEVDLTGKDANRAPSMLGRASRRVLLEKLAVVFNMASSGRDTTDSADLGVEVGAKGRIIDGDLGPFRPADEGATGAYGYGRSRARSSTGGGTAIRPVVSKWQGARTRLRRLPVKHRVEVRLVDEQAPRHQVAVEAWATALFAEEDMFQLGLPVSADLAQNGTFQPGAPVEHGRLAQKPAWAGPDGIGPGVIEVRSGFDEARKQIETLLSRAGLEPALAARRAQQLLPDHVGEADFDRLLQHRMATVLRGDGTVHTVEVQIEGLTWSGVTRDATGRNPVILYIGSESASAANTRRRHHGWSLKGSHGPSELGEGEPKKFWDPFNLLLTPWARGGGRAFGSGTSTVGNLVTLSEAGSLGVFAHELTFTIKVTVGDGMSVREETVDGSAWALLPVGMSPRDPNVLPLEYHQPDPMPADDRLSEVLAGAKMLHLDARGLVDHVASRLGGVEAGNALRAAGVTVAASLSRDNLISAGMSLLTEDGFPFEVVTTPALDGRKRRGSIVSRLPVLRTPRGEHRTVEIRYKPTNITYVGPTDDTVMGHIFMAMSGHTLTDERARDRSREGNGGEGVHPDAVATGGDGTIHRGRGETTRSFASRTGADEGLAVQVGGQYIVEVETGRYVTIDGKEEQISNGRVVLSFSELDMLQGYADGILPMQIDDALDALGRYAQGRLELDRVTAARILHRVRQDPQLSTGRRWSSRDLLPADELATKLAGEFTEAGFTGPTLTPGNPEAYLGDLAAWVEQHYRDIPAVPGRDQAQFTALLEHLEPQGGESRLKDLQLDTRAVPLDPRNAHLRASAARRPGTTTLLDIVRDRIETAAPGAEKRNMGLRRELWGLLAGERAWQGLYDAMRSRDGWRGSFVDSHHGYDQTIDVRIAIRPKASRPMTLVGRMKGVLLIGQRYGYTESGTAAMGHAQRSRGLHGNAGRGDWGGGVAGTWGHSRTGTGNYAEQHTRLDRLNDRSGAYLAREDFELEISVSVRPPTRRDRMVARLHARRVRRQAAVRAEQRRALAAAGKAAGGTPAQVPRSRRAFARLARDAARRSVTTVDGHVIRYVPVDALEDAYGRPRQVPRLSAEDLLPDPRGVLLSQMSYVRDTDPGPLREQLEEALKQHIGVGSPDWGPAMRGLDAALHPAHFNAMLRGMAAGGHLLVPVRVGGRTIEVRVTARFSWARDVLPDSGTPEHGYVHRLQRTAGVRTEAATEDSAKLDARVPAVGGAVSVGGPGLSLEHGRTVGETEVRTRGDRDETSLFVEFPTGLAEMTVHFSVSLPIARRWRGPGMEYFTAEGTTRVFVPQGSVAGELEARRTSGWSQFGFVGPLTGEAVLDYGALLLAASDDGTLTSGMAPYSALIRKLGEVAARDTAGYAMSVADPVTGAQRSVGEGTAAPPLSVVVDQASAGRPPDPLVQLQFAASALGRDIIVDVQGPRGPELFLVRSDGSLVSRVPGDGFGAALGLLDPRYIDRAHRLGADLRAIYERYRAQQQGTPAPDRTFSDEVRDRLDELAGGPAPAAFGRAESLFGSRFHGAAGPGSGDRVVAEVRRRLAGAAALSVGGHVSQLSAVVERDGVFTVSVQRSDRLVRFTVWVGEVEPGEDGRLPMAQRSVRRVPDEGGRAVFAADIVVSESGAVDLVLDALVHDMRETLSHTQREVAARPGLLRWARTDHDAGVVAQLTVQARRLADLLAGVSEMQANASLEQRDVAGREVVQIVRSAWLVAAIVHEVGGVDPSSARWAAMVASVSSRRDRLLLEQVRRLVTDLNEVQAIDAWWRRDAVAAAASGIRALRALPHEVTLEQAAQAEQDAIEAVLATLDPAHQAGAYDLDPPEASLAQPLLRAAASPAPTPTTDVAAAMALAAAVRTADGLVDADGLAALLDHIPVVTVPDDGGGRGLRNALLSFANDHAPSDRAVITMASEGRSAAAVFLVGEAGSPPTRVVKVFADPARMAQELSALERLAAAGLTGVRLPMPYAVFMIDTGSRRLGVLIGDHLGPTLGDLLVRAATGDSTAQAALPSAAAETGRAFRQLHEAVAGDTASGYVARHAERLRARAAQLLDDPQRYGLPATAALRRRLEEVIAAAVADPGPSSLVHGDPKPDNITLDPDQRRVGLIDLWRAHTGLDERGRPTGSAANDVAFFEEHLMTRALAEGLSAEHAATLPAAFRQAYGPARAPDAVLTMFRARYLVRAILDAPGGAAAPQRAALVGRLMDVLGIDGGATGGTAPAPPGPGSGGPASRLLVESRRLATLLGAHPDAVEPAELVHRAWLVAGLLLGSTRADLDGRQRWRAMVDGLADPADRELLDGMLRLLTGGEPRPAGWRGEALATVVAAVVGLRARPELTPADVAAAQQAVTARLLSRLAPTARPSPSLPPVRWPSIWVPPWLEELPPSQARQLLDQVLPPHGGPPSDAVVARQLAALLDGRYERAGRPPVELWVRSAAAQGPGVVALTLDVCTGDARVVVSRWLARAPDGTLELRRPNPDPHADIMAAVDARLARALAVLSARPPRPGANP